MPPAAGKSNKRLLKAGWMSTNRVNGLLPLGPAAKYIKGTEPFGLNHETLTCTCIISLLIIIIVILT